MPRESLPPADLCSSQQVYSTIVCSTSVKHSRLDPVLLCIMLGDLYTCCRFSTRAGGATLRFSTWIYGHTLNEHRTSDGHQLDGWTDGRTDILESTTMWGSLRLAPIMEWAVISLAYPMTSFHVNISSMFNKVLDCFDSSLFSQL